MLEAHSAIVAALAERDFATAREWMVRHMADFRRGYEHAGCRWMCRLAVQAKYRQHG